MGAWQAVGSTGGSCSMLQGWNCWLYCWHCERSGILLLGLIFCLIQGHHGKGREQWRKGGGAAEAGGEWDWQ